MIVPSDAVPEMFKMAAPRIRILFLLAAVICMDTGMRLMTPSPSFLIMLTPARQLLTSSVRHPRRGDGAWSRCWEALLKIEDDIVLSTDHDIDFHEWLWLRRLTAPALIEIVVEMMAEVDRW